MKTQTTENPTKSIEKALAGITRGTRSSQAAQTASRQGFSAKGDGAMPVKPFDRTAFDKRQAAKQGPPAKKTREEMKEGLIAFAKAVRDDDRQKYNPKELAEMVIEYLR